MPVTGRLTPAVLLSGLEKQNSPMTTPYSLFVPNKLSVPTVTVDAKNQLKLHKFLTDYFFGWHNGQQQFKPFAYAGLMLEEVESEVFDDVCLPADEDDVAPFDSIQHWLKTVVDNFGDDVIILCSHYC